LWLREPEHFWSPGIGHWFSLAHEQMRHVYLHDYLEMHEFAKQK
jgi:hypothetical protein